MKTNVYITVPLGELIAAVFDETARYSSDTGEISRLATSAVKDILERKGRTSLFRNRSRQTLKWPVFRDIGHA